MKIDFVSDVTCPWCAIGLAALEQAIARLGSEVSVQLQLQPFELNPGMPPGGEDLAHYVTRKYGASPAVLAARQAKIRTIVLPRQNRRDVVQISPRILHDLEFRYVDRVDEVLDIALLPTSAEPAPRSEEAPAAAARKIAVEAAKPERARAGRSSRP